MDFYRITENIHDKTHQHLGKILSPAGRVNPNDFRIGKQFLNPIDLFINTKLDHSFDFNMAAFEVPIISPRLADVLKTEFVPDRQFIPVEIGGEPYYILNALHTIRCLDESNSTFTKWTQADERPELVGEYRMVTSLRIDSELAEGADFLRIDGWNVPLIVSDSVKTLFDRIAVREAIFAKVT